MISIKNFLKPYRKAFTLAEVLIACGLLSLLLTALFGVFRGGSGGFQSGQWQIQTQKQAQLFLNQLRELLEKANNAESYSSTNSPDIKELPIYIKSDFMNKLTALAGPTPLLFFSITTAYNARNDLIGAPEKRGTWAGVSLAAVRGSGTGYKLVLKRSGLDTDHILCGPPYTAALAGANFDSESLSRRFTLELDEVKSIGFVTTEPGTIEITVVLSHDFGGGRVINLRESVRAKLMNSDLKAVSYSF